MDKENIVHTHTQSEILLSFKKEENPVTFYNVDEM